MNVSDALRSGAEFLLSHAHAAKSLGTNSSDPSGDHSDDGATEILHVVLCIALGGVLLAMSLEVLQHRYHITWLPGPATSVLVGLILGLFIRLNADDEANIPDELGFSGSVFFLIMLPIIIFQAGYSLRKKEFFGQLFTILTFSIVGTVIAAFIIGVILYAASSSGLMLDLSFNEAMAYASILSATDAVAVANIYRALDADPMLTVMIYGEGSVNDAASIVMYQTFSEFIEEGATDEGFGIAAKHFLVELFGSIGVGIALGIATTFVFRIVHMGWIPAWVGRVMPCCPRSRVPTGSNHLRSDSSLVAGLGQAYEDAPLLMSPSGQATPRKTLFGAGDDDAHRDRTDQHHEPSNSTAAAAAIAAATPGHLPRTNSGSQLAADVVSAIRRDHEVKPDSSVFAQTSFILTAGYLSYMAAESVHLSGVVSVLFTGISLNHFVRPLMDSEGKNFSEGTVRVLADVADMACFFQVGLDMALTFGTNRGLDTKGDAALLGFVLLAVMISRAVSVFGLSMVLNYYRREPVPGNHQMMLWHAGLRGAGAYAFTLVFPTTNRDVLVDATAGVVLITVLACGASSSRMLTWLGIPWGHHEHGSHGHHGVIAGPGSSILSPSQQAALLSSTGRGADGVPGSAYKVVMVSGARVYVPVASAAGGGNRRDRAIGWINRWDTKIRYWVSGVVRED